MGFYVFPIAPNKKAPPLIPYFPTSATRDKIKIKIWWGNCPTSNIGISTTRFKESEALLVVDIDQNPKKGKMGEDGIFLLELKGMEFPTTLEQRTPSGGRHLIYKTKTAVKQSVGKLAPGIDIRSYGGYILGAGSVLSNGIYVLGDGEIVDAPEWLVSYCDRPTPKSDNIPLEGAQNIDRENAFERAKYYLEAEAPLAIQGSGGDQTTFAVAARVKDFGVGLRDALELMLLEWNSRCQPPWAADALEEKVRNAYRYGINPPGSAAPEVVFKNEEVKNTKEKKDMGPIGNLNNEYAFTISGGGHHILWETKDNKNNFKLEHLDVMTFHRRLAAHTMSFGDKTKPITEIWLRHKDRRSYDGICFMPGQKSPPQFYNLWRGFAVEPHPKETTYPQHLEDTLQKFFEHIKLNICSGVQEHYEWVLTYFAHLIQKPWEKPLVALVFKGEKGVGKNFVVEQIGDLLGNHALVTSDRRYLLGNFNGHFENCLLFVLDEAFWSGDKQAQGVLQGLITSQKHIIEHKGKEPYTVDNCTRVCLLSNEEWVVPASSDERRYAIFNVGSGRKQDTKFFVDIKNGMKKGANRLLLRFLMDYDLTKRDVNIAPQTEGLKDQKESSLIIVHQWWVECLKAGEFLGSDFGQEWPGEVSKTRVFEAFKRHQRDNPSVRYFSPISFGRQLKKCVKFEGRNKITVGETRYNSYHFPTLSAARQQWDEFIGYPGPWV